MYILSPRSAYTTALSFFSDASNALQIQYVYDRTHHLLPNPVFRFFFPSEWPPLHGQFCRPEAGAVLETPSAIQSFRNSCLFCVHKHWICLFLAVPSTVLVKYTITPCLEFTTVNRQLLQQSPSWLLCIYSSAFWDSQSNYFGQQWSCVLPCPHSTPEYLFIGFLLILDMLKDVACKAYCDWAPGWLSGSFSIILSLCFLCSEWLTTWPHFLLTMFLPQSFDYGCPSAWSIFQSHFHLNWTYSSYSSQIKQSLTSVTSSSPPFTGFHYPESLFHSI